METYSNEKGHKTPHDQYTEAYVGILNAYREQLSQSVQKKNDLKEEFFKAIRFIMFGLGVVFAIAVLFALAIMALMVIKNYSSAAALAGSMVSLISSFVTMVLAIYKLPKIIADYLFNKEEDQLMNGIMQNIQKYELEAVKTERMRGIASFDAAISELGKTEDDSEMEDSHYMQVDKVSDSADVCADGTEILRDEN